MNNDILIRPAQAGEAHLIAELIRGSFSPELQNAMIYGCHGIDRFISRQIEAPLGLSDTMYIVAIAQDLIIGCVELRWLQKALFLNYICTHPEARSKGLARRLLADSIMIARRDHHREMLLDVFEDNLPAKNWYERLGFQHDYATEWWDVPLPTISASFSGKVSGYPHALVNLEQYGFSMLKLITKDREYEVGIMGHDWFRVTQIELLSDPEAVAMLQSIDGKRRILAMIRKGSVLSPHLETRRIVTSIRMSMDMDRLFTNLTE